jgi:thiol-disulfide isomerase/thioredoxin
MMKAWPVVAAVSVFVCATAAQGQSLGELAKKIEESRKAGGEASVVFDERDMNPELARRDLLSFRLDPLRWLRFVEVDRHIAVALKDDPSVLQRLEGLNYTSVRSVGRFFQREPVIARLLKGANVDAHEYASTYLATKLAFSDLPEALDPDVSANAAFLRTRQHETRALAIPLGTLSLHTLAASAPRAAATPPIGPTTRPPAAASVPLPPRMPNAGGVIDMSAGAEIPDFDFIDFEGRRRQLSDFRGRYLMLDFWGSWCPPCRAEIPFVQDAYARFGSRGFEVLGMDSERSATVDEVRAYLQKNGVPWTFATPDSVRDIIDTRFQITSFPRVILLGPDGRVIEASNHALRGENLAKTLDRLLPKEGRFANGPYKITRSSPTRLVIR